MGGVQTKPDASSPAGGNSSPVIAVRDDLKEVNLNSGAEKSDHNAGYSRAMVTPPDSTTLNGSSNGPTVEKVDPDADIMCPESDGMTSRKHALPILTGLMLIDFRRDHAGNPSRYRTAAGHQNSRHLGQSYRNPLHFPRFCDRIGSVGFRCRPR